MQLQDAGAPNEAGSGVFIPLSANKNSISFVDVMVNANLSDPGNYSSIINATVTGTTFSTSTRLGYRRLNSNRSWMYGINAGHDSRPMATGPTDTDVAATNSQTVFFQQVVTGPEAASNIWNLNASALTPESDTNKTLNSRHRRGSLHTYGLDVGYSIAPDFSVAPEALLPIGRLWLCK